MNEFAADVFAGPVKLMALGGATINTWIPLRRIRSAMSCMVKVFPAPLVPRIAMFAFL